MSEFLLDENALGLDRFLENHVKYRKVGDTGCPALKTKDPEIVKFAKENNLIIVTKDIKMVDACKFEKMEYVTFDNSDFAKKVIEYSES